jgi:hypothetical protein
VPTARRQGAASRFIGSRSVRRRFEYKRITKEVTIIVKYDNKNIRDVGRKT